MSDYRIQGKLGQGAMGIVYRAVQEPLGRQVALKVIQGSSLRDPTILKRFEREVEACIKLQHANIIRILDYGVLEGQNYYVMELIEDALTLEQYLRAAPLKIDTAANLMDQLLDALDFCHARGFIHRDVKPANIMVKTGDHVVLMDFGLVKPVERTVITEDGQIVGTPRYTAPEVLKGAPPSPASDLFALGAIFYHMLTGKFAFTGSSISEVVTALLKSDPAPVSVNRHDAPEGTDALIQRFLAKEPAQRFPSAAAAREAVAQWKNAPRQRRSGVHDRRSLALDRSGAHRSLANAPAGVFAGTPSSPGIRVLAVAGIGACLIGIGVVAWRAHARAGGAPRGPSSIAAGTAASPGAHDASDIDVWWGATMAEAIWVSRDAYAASVEVVASPSRAGEGPRSGGEGESGGPPGGPSGAPPGGPPGAPAGGGTPGLRGRATEDAPVTRHQLAVTGLEPGTPMVLRARIADAVIFERPGLTIPADAPLDMALALLRASDLTHILSRLRRDRMDASAVKSALRAAANDRVDEQYKGAVEKTFLPLRLDRIARDVDGTREIVRRQGGWPYDRTDALLTLVAELRLLEGVARTHGWTMPTSSVTLSRLPLGQQDGPVLRHPRSIEVVPKGMAVPPPLDSESLGVFKLDEGARFSTWGRTGLGEFTQFASKHEPWRTATDIPIPMDASAREAELVAHVEGLSPRTFVRVDLATRDHALRTIARLWTSDDKAQDVWCGVDPSFIGSSARVRMELVDDGDDAHFSPPGKLHYLSIRWR